MIAKTTTTTHLAQMLSSACRLRRYDMSGWTYGVQCSLIRSGRIRHRVVPEIHKVFRLP